MAELGLLPREALAGLRIETPELTIVPVEGQAWAALALRGGRRELPGLALPAGPGASFDGATTLLWAAPRQWFALGEAGLAARLVAHVGGDADVTDLTGSRVTIELAGLRARATLTRIVALDLHPGVFVPGVAAATLAGHVGVMLWAVEEQRYRLSCYRSFGLALWHALSTAAA